MRILPPVEEQIRRIVRNERAKDPLISVAGLEKALEEHFQRGFSHQYVSKIADKVMREALVQADRTKIEHRLNFTRENYRMIRERLMKIVYWQPTDTSTRPPLNRDVNEAAKNIVMMDLALLNAEIAAGLYRTQDEAAERLRYAPMPEERRQLVIAAFMQWGLIPKAQVEAIVGPALPDGTITATVIAAN
jgi:hypothetical protein